VPPRPYWKGFLRLSLVACPIQVFPATSEREKIRFHQINKATGHRIEYRKVDAVTGEPVHDQDIVRGYEIGEGRYIEITEEELEAVAIESAHTIDIDLFVPKKEIDELYWNTPYYVAPDGEVGRQAFAVIREAIGNENVVALGRVVFTTREDVIAIEPRGKGLLGITLRYPYEIRAEERKKRKRSISAIYPMRRSPTTCSIWRSMSSGARSGISRRKSSRIDAKKRSRS
jgi:DNA end-binding protein Ku